MFGGVSVDFRGSRSRRLIRDDLVRVYMVRRGDFFCYIWEAGPVWFLLMMVKVFNTLCATLRMACMIPRYMNWNRQRGIGM